MSGVLAKVDKTVLPGSPNNRCCNYDVTGHLDPPANGQAVIYLTGLLEVFIFESFILATVSDVTGIKVGEEDRAPSGICESVTNQF